MLTLRDTSMNSIFFQKNTMNRISNLLIECLLKYSIMLLTEVFTGAYNEKLE